MLCIVLVEIMSPLFSSQMAIPEADSAEEAAAERKNILASVSIFKKGEPSVRARLVLSLRSKAELARRIHRTFQRALLGAMAFSIVGKSGPEFLVVK